MKTLLTVILGLTLALAIFYITKDNLILIFTFVGALIGILFYTEKLNTNRKKDLINKFSKLKDKDGDVTIKLDEVVKLIEK